MHIAIHRNKIKLQVHHIFFSIFVKLNKHFFSWRICKHKIFEHQSFKIKTCSNCKVDDGGKEQKFFNVDEAEFDLLILVNLLVPPPFMLVAVFVAERFGFKVICPFKKAISHILFLIISSCLLLSYSGV